MAITPISLTLRNVKGSAVTATENDANLTALKTASEELDTAVDLNTAKVTNVTTNLSTTTTATTNTVVSSDGTDAVLPAATQTVAGVMTGADKTKLDGVAIGATANTGTVTAVTGTAPIVSSGGTTPALSMAAATAIANGYMTSTYAAKLDGISGTNTGDQTSIVGISGTVAQFNTAITDATLSGNNTGDQVISDATLATTDITTNNFTIAKHGFVPKGTNVGNFLKDDGTWSAIGGGGGGAMELISTTVVSASVASVDFTLSGYSKYKLVFSSFTSSATLTKLIVQDIGVDITTASYRYRRNLDGVLSSSTGNTSCYILAIASTDTYIEALIDTSSKINITSVATGISSDAVVFQNLTASLNNAYTVTNIDGIRIVPAAGTIDSGTFSLYGIKG